VCRDRGSGSIWLAGLLAVVMLTATVGLAAGTAVLARHRAEAAADLAALAGAARIAEGEADGCAAARKVAAANGGRVSACVRTGEDLDVMVSAPVEVVGLGVLAVSARARAGPVDRPSPGP
jgi:secretion/DNA translocation related TadE-like protein